MVIFERDKPKHIICWTIVFLLTNIIGYILYILNRLFIHKKSSTLSVKKEEDDIYSNLVSSNLLDVSSVSSDDLFEFNKLAYNSKITKNNEFETYSKHSKFIENLKKDLVNAKNYILIEADEFKYDDFSVIKPILSEKSKEGLFIRLVYDSFFNRKLKKELKNEGIRINKFSKVNSMEHSFENIRNMISIDGNIIYFGALTSNKIKDNIECAGSYLKIKGDVVQEIDLSLRKDAIFASGKYMEYKTKFGNEIKNGTSMQFVSNEVNQNLELLIIKAISLSKKSIQLELQEFIPTESIMSLLHFAINSNIDVRLMIPLKTKKKGKYYASRAYAKELALWGANVYLFDGYIQFNAITIDSKYVIYGDFTMDRNKISTDLQDILLVEDEKFVLNYNKLFNLGINNSYRINDAKFMLLKEKFFRKFI